MKKDAQVKRGRPTKGDPPKLNMEAEEIAKGIFRIAIPPAPVATRKRRNRLI